MKTTIREGVFETNSSSTHSLIMLPESEFKKWKNGELLYQEDTPWIEDDKLREEFVKKYVDHHNDLYTKEEVEEIKKFYADHGIEVDEDDYENWDYCFQTYERWCEEDELESDRHYYTTPGGEKIVAVAKYGYR